MRAHISGPDHLVLTGTNTLFAALENAGFADVPAEPDGAFTLWATTSPPALPKPFGHS